MVFGDRPLSSVGAGEVLRDVLAADNVPQVRLTQVFRQAAKSGVVVNAHRINAGKPPQLQGMTDFFLFPCEDTDETAALTVDVACTRIPARFGLDPRRDIQVLAPMHRGPAGAGALNGLLQQRLTPARDGLPERRSGGRVFRIGDKVTQIRNNYDKGQAGVFNGTLGVITALSTDEQLALLAITFVAYYCGGYVAARMARFNGVRQGLAVWLWAVVIAVVVAILGLVAGNQYDVLAKLNSLPRVPVNEGSVTTAGVIALLAVAVVSLIGAVLGGLAGMRFHRNVDRTGLGL